MHQAMIDQQISIIGVTYGGVPVDDRYLKEMI